MEPDVAVYRFPGHYDDYLILLGVFGFLQRQQKAGPRVVHQNAVALGLQILPAAVAVAAVEEEALQAKLK